MQMNKLIIKTALITICTLVIASGAVFSLWLVCSPQTMASSCEKTGNYALAVTCADLRYKYTKNVYNLARSADDAILSGRDNLISDRGEKLLSHEKFEEVCKTLDASSADNGLGFGYKAYICGHVSASQYRLGNTDKAVQTALYGGEKAFPKLVIEICSARDKTSAQAVLAALEKLEQTGETSALSELLKKI